MIDIGFCNFDRVAGFTIPADPDLMVLFLEEVAKMDANNPSTVNMSKALLPYAVEVWFGKPTNPSIIYMFDTATVQFEFDGEVYVDASPDVAIKSLKHIFGL